jgi:DNA-binding LytR/AlgR family response regulator
MNIVIIEDELKTARALAQLITDVKIDAKIVATIQSVEAAVGYLSTNPRPDLIFMDVQLADGLSFEIFKEIKVSSPIVFCTAFDDYAIEAFKSNGIDYILKPFSRETIMAAFEKVDQMKNFFQVNQPSVPELEALLSSVVAQPGKKSFLVFKNNKYLTIATQNIAFFYIRNELPTIMTLDQQEYIISQSLDEVHQLLSQKQFFRLNRQYLVNFDAIKDVEHYFARKLVVHLVIPSPDKLLVSKDKVTPFLNWLENQ